MDRGDYCTGWEIFWYYEPEYAACQRFYYGGCAGNDNRFNSEEECLAACAAPATETSELPATPHAIQGICCFVLLKMQFRLPYLRCKFVRQCEQALNLLTFVIEMRYDGS